MALAAEPPIRGGGLQTRTSVASPTSLGPAWTRNPTWIDLRNQGAPREKPRILGHFRDGVTHGSYDVSMSRSSSREAKASHIEGPPLRGLGPEYQERLHGRHAEALLDVLLDEERRTVKNIALSGHYGSGKSSVLLGVQAELTRKNIHWVNLSLSSLGIDDAKRGRIQGDGALAPLTNLIQKEIVKQVLYRKSPASMPKSRYLRIDSFRPKPAAIWAAVAALGFFATSVLLGLVSRVEVVSPATWVTDERAWAPWAVVAAISLFVGGVTFLAQREFQNMLRVEGFSAGGASVKLSAKENSYFDEYLDEIVYFFERTRTRVAIFEDLDRFEDPHIFETLRELNTVLNNSEQLNGSPIRFVYAIRDSIFEQLKVDAGPTNTDEARGESEPRFETAPSANRTKFFDLVVPMVPFLTHRSARDLLAAEFAESDAPPSEDLMDLVGAHLTDMRLIRNVRNEFEIYRASILGESGLEGLTADRLFAMMVYKNLHLADFESIRLGASKIDRAYDAFREMVEHQSGYQAARRKAAQDRVESHALWDVHAKAAGERLQQVLPVIQGVSGHAGPPTVQHDGKTYALQDVTSPTLWRSLGEGNGPVRVNFPGLRHLNLSAAEFMAFVGGAATTISEAVQVDVARLEAVAQKAAETKNFVAKATMAELLARTDLVMPTDDGADANLVTIVADLVSDLTLDLLVAGFIDENFALYCSDYQGIALSVSAMNFILHCVQPNRADYRFKFDAPTSIVAVEKEMGARFLDRQSVFNIEVFEYYLEEDPGRLDGPFDRLSTTVQTDTSFVDAFLVDGRRTEAFVAAISPRWRGVLVYLVESAPIDAASLLDFMDVAVAKCQLDQCDVSESLAVFIAESHPRMETFSGDVETSLAAGVAALMSRLAVQADDLRVLGEEQRKAVIAAGAYPITRTNLSAALGGDSSLALDAIKEADAAVYKRVLEGLDEYLAVLDGDEVTVGDPTAFIDVIGDVSEVDESAVLEVAARSSGPCTIADLGDLEKAAWPVLVRASRVVPTVANVSQFIGEFGVTDAMAGILSTADLSAAEDMEMVERVDLALVLLDTTSLTPDARVRLAQQLNLSDPLDVDRLGDAAVDLLPELLRSGLVPDAWSTFAPLGGRDFTLVEDYFAASENVATYVCELPLSAEQVTRLFKSRRVQPTVKQAVAADPAFVADRLSRDGAIAICRWAESGNVVPSELLAPLAEADAPAELILSLLEQHLSDMSLELLDRILRALGDEYEPQTRTGRHRPKVKDRPGTPELLEELQRRDRVSSFKATKILGTIRVNMRH